MIRNILSSIVVTFAFAGLFAVSGQTPEAAIKPVYKSGDVISLSADKIVLKTAAGPFEAAVTDKTAYKRLAPDSLNFASATAGAFSDVATGDKATVSALLGADGKTMNARTVYFVTKADQLAKSAKEMEKWRTRGITGRVASVDPATKEIIVESPGLAGPSKVTLTPAAAVKFLRYAPDSIRYDEAKPSTIAEIKAGDMIRALGDRLRCRRMTFTRKRYYGGFSTVAARSNRSTRTKMRS